jgi:drug/metabolite transporter (DMT)-like permease
MTSLWLPLTIVSAFFLGTSDALTKKALAGHNEYLVTWLKLLPSLPLFLLPLLLMKIPPVRPEFYLCVALGLPLEALAIFLYTKALKLSPLNLTLPLLSLTPLLLLVIPSLLLGERITWCGGLGILLIAAGSYLLNLNRHNGAPMAPLRALLSEKGSLCMIMVAAIYSITSTLGKKAIAASSPLFFAAVYLPLLVVVISPVALFMGKQELRLLRSNGTIKASALPALCYSLQALTHVYAINLTNVAYMIAVKRLSLLFGVLYGRWLFQEQGGIAATSIMLAGVFLIVLGQ